MNRHALLSLGLLITGIAAAVPGCGEETSNGDGNKAGDAGAAGKDAGGEHAGGTGNLVPSAGAGGEGGAAPAHGGAGGSPEGGATSAGAGGVANGGAGGEGIDYGSCLAARSFGNVGALDGIASDFGDAGGEGFSGILRIEGSNYVELAVDLYDGLSPFEGGLTTLTNHVLADDDLNYGTCGLCLRLLERDENNVPTREYLVTGGKVTLTNVDGRLSGSASNLTFEEVTVDESTYHSTPVADGCRSRINGVSFDEEVHTDGAGGAGGGGGAGN